MSKKLNIRKKSKAEIFLSPEESDELQMIVDRIAVQTPEGESFELYLQSLRNALASRPHLAMMLVDKLSRNPNATGFRTFRMLEGAIEASPYRRHLKQAAYRFAQRGFAPGPDVAAAPEKVVLIQGEARRASAHFFLVPGTLWLVSILVPEGGPAPYSLVTAFLEDDYASFNVRVTESNQKQYREYLQKISGYSAGLKPLEIPVWHGARLFSEMADMSTGQGRRAEIEQGRDLLKRYQEPGKKPYAYELFPEMEDPRRHLEEIIVPELFEGMDLSWLRFSREELGPTHEKLNQLDSPLLVVPREVQLERSHSLIRGVADTLCSGKKRFIVMRFFEEQAMALKLCSDEKRAVWAWTIAQHLAGDSPAGENPAVYQLISYSLKYYWPDDFKTQHTQSPLQQERRTDSGIILP